MYSLMEELEKAAKRERPNSGENSCVQPHGGVGESRQARKAKVRREFLCTASWRSWRKPPSEKGQIQVRIPVYSLMEELEKAAKRERPKSGENSCVQPHGGVGESRQARKAKVRREFLS